MDEVGELTINWDRCVQVDDVINDSLVRKLTPQILAFRQASNDPITVAINSPGGSLAAMDVLLGLLKGPNQDDIGCSVITVATHKAYSAAASLLAYGDYAIALPHSEVLFHDVRYGEMEDVTPDKAMKAARRLQSANEGFSLRLANHVFKRLMWNYIDLKLTFDSVSKKIPKKVQEYKDALQPCGLTLLPSVIFDPAMYASGIFSHLTRQNGSLIDRSMGHLGRWGAAMAVAASTPMYATAEGESGFLEGALKLYRAMHDGKPEDDKFGSAKNADALRLFLTLTLARLAGNTDQRFDSTLEQGLSDYRLVNSMNDPKHKFTAKKLMLRHKAIFFSEDAATTLDGGDVSAKEQVLEAAAPLVTVMWHFCVLMCRELFNGEHNLSPKEAQIMGLVDEVPGMHIVGSIRQFRVEKKNQNAIASPA